ncbi:putative 60 kDa chaperonin, partial [Escherichia coli O111:H8 str. CVM9570]
AEEVSGRPVAARTKAKNLKAIPLSILKLMRNLKRPVKHLWILAHILLRL